MSHREEPETVPDGDLNLPWVPGGDDAYLAADEPPDALMQLRVNPQVQIQVTTSYQLTLAVKGGGPAVINPSVLFDAVSTAARYIASHQPGPGSEPPKEDK